MYRKYKLIKDGRTLKAMINKGLIKEAKYEFYPFVDADNMKFEYKGATYIARYIDGNFYNLIYKIIS